MSSSILEVARHYTSAGISVVPIAADGSKQPIGKWKSLQTTIMDDAEIDRRFRGHVGIATITGSVSGNLELLDIDNPDLVKPFEAIVPQELLAKLHTVATPRNNFGGRHYRYRLPCKPAGNTKLAESEPVPQFNSDGSPQVDQNTGEQKLSPNTWIETRGEGGYALAPGCPGECHQTGLPYKYISGPPIDNLEVLTDEEHKLLWRAAQSFNRNIGSDAGNLDGFTATESSGLTAGTDFNERATWGEILDPAGWAVAASFGEMTYWKRPGKDGRGWSATTGCKSKNGNELLSVFSSNAQPFQGPSNGKPCSAYTKFAAYTLISHGGDYRKAAAALYEANYGEKTEAQKTKPLKTSKNEGVSPTKRKLVIENYTPFPVDQLPDPLSRFIKAGAKAVGCDPSYIALPIMTVVAGAIGMSRQIRLKNSWDEPPILWTAIVGESGTAKTPAFRIALRTIRRRQERAIAKFSDAMKDYETAMARYDRDHAEWKRKKCGEPPMKPEPPNCTRYLVSDTTVEGLATILQDNPRGTTLVRDELSGWIGSHDRYAAKGKGGADLAHWLSMFNGETLLVDRKTGINRVIYVPMAAVSVTGGIQPAILQQAMSIENRESGLLARILLTSPPIRSKRWTDADIDPLIELAMDNLFDRLLSLEPYADSEGRLRPVPIPLSREARTEFIAFYNEHNRRHAELSGDLAAASSKLEGYVARFALIIHLVRWAMNDTALANGNEVDVQSIRAGVALSQWFGNEARRVYTILSDSEEVRDLRRLVEVIQRLGGRVTPRDINKATRQFSGNADAAETALVELVKQGIGRWENSDPNAAGRPTRYFQLFNMPDVGETPPNPDNVHSFADNTLEITPTDEEGEWTA